MLTDLPWLCLPLLAGMLLWALILRRRLATAHARLEYQHLRLQRCTRAYHLVVHSHRHMERQMSQLTGASQSLREALGDIEQQARPSSEASEAVLGQKILGVLGSYGALRMASLHRVTGPAANPQVEAPALACLGEPPPLDTLDPLITAALSSGQLSSQTETSAAHPHILCAIPLTDVAGRIWAVVAVYQMPFVAFQEEHLNLLAVLGGHLGDLLRARASSDEQPFHAAVQRSLHDAQRHHLPAALVGLVPGKEVLAGSLLELLLSQHRALDQSLLMQGRAGRPVLLLHLPLTDQQGVDGYLSRMDGLVREQYGIGLSDAAQVHPVVLRGADASARRIAELYRRCQAHV